MNLTPLPSPAPAPASSLPCPCRYRSHLITPPPSSPHLRVHQIPAPTHRILTPPTSTHPCRARRITPPLYPCPLQHYQRAHLAPTHPVFTPALPLLQPNPCTPLHPHTPRIVHTSSHPAPLTACTHPRTTKGRTPFIPPPHHAPPAPETEQKGRHQRRGEETPHLSAAPLFSYPAGKPKPPHPAPLPPPSLTPAPALASTPDHTPADFPTRTSHPVPEPLHPGTPASLLA